VVGRLIDGRGHWVLAAGLGLVVGVLVYMAFGQNHTKTVVQTKTVTRTVRVAGEAKAFDGTPQALAAYMKPKTAQQVQCPTSFKNSTCFVFQTNDWFTLYVIPAT
jgi:hypothetical protein